MLRKDRLLQSRGGGVSVFVRRNLNVAQIVFADSYSTLEIVGFDLLYERTKLRFLLSIDHPIATTLL